MNIRGLGTFAIRPEHTLLLADPDFTHLIGQGFVALNAAHGQKVGRGPSIELRSTRKNLTLCREFPDMTFPEETRILSTP